jgi:hypothetical protein
MKYTEPIIDRTADDIAEQTSKAFWNISDWTRVHDNAKVAKILLDFLLDISIDDNALPKPTRFTFPPASAINQLIENIEAVRIAAGLPEITGLAKLKTDWKDGTSAVAPNYLDVNQWERNCGIIYNSIRPFVEYGIGCGVSNAGQPRFYQNQWRRVQTWVQPAETPVRRFRTNNAICGAGLQRGNGYRRY